MSEKAFHGYTLRSAQAAKINEYIAVLIQCAPLRTMKCSNAWRRSSTNVASIFPVQRFSGSGGMIVPNVNISVNQRRSSKQFEECARVTSKVHQQSVVKPLQVAEPTLYLSSRAWEVRAVRLRPANQGQCDGNRPSQSSTPVLQKKGRKCLTLVKITYCVYRE